jgi:hypothetical protein
MIFLFLIGKAFLNAISSWFTMALEDSESPTAASQTSWTLIHFEGPKLCPQIIKCGIFDHELRFMFMHMNTERERARERESERASEGGREREREREEKQKEKEKEKETETERERECYTYNIYTCISIQIRPHRKCRGVVV